MNVKVEFASVDLRERSIYFLHQIPSERFQILSSLGISRYNFLTQIPLTENNIICMMEFFKDTRRLKFPRLRNADLSDLILDGVNWIRGDLTQAKLIRTRLWNADLIFANFAHANLTDADLTGATLNETCWLNTQVIGCQFGEGIGLTAQQRQELKQRGGLFDSFKVSGIDSGLELGQVSEIEEVLGEVSTLPKDD